MAILLAESRLKGNTARSNSAQRRFFARQPAHPTDKQQHAQHITEKATAKRLAHLSSTALLYCTLPCTKKRMISSAMVALHACFALLASCSVCVCVCVASCWVRIDAPLLVGKGWSMYKNSKIQLPAMRQRSTVTRPLSKIYQRKRVTHRASFSVRT